MIHESADLVLCHVDPSVPGCASGELYAVQQADESVALRYVTPVAGGAFRLTSPAADTFDCEVDGGSIRGIYRVQGVLRRIAPDEVRLVNGVAYAVEYAPRVLTVRQ